MIPAKRKEQGGASAHSKCLQPHSFLKHHKKTSNKNHKHLFYNIIKGSKNTIRLSADILIASAGFLIVSADTIRIFLARFKSF